MPSKLSKRFIDLVNSSLKPKQVYTVVKETKCSSSTKYNNAAFSIVLDSGIGIGLLLIQQIPVIKRQNIVLLFFTGRFGGI